MKIIGVNGQSPLHMLPVIRQAGEITMHPTNHTCSGLWQEQSELNRGRGRRRQVHRRSRPVGENRYHLSSNITGRHLHRNFMQARGVPRATFVRGHAIVVLKIYAATLLCVTQPLRRRSLMLANRFVCVVSWCLRETTDRQQKRRTKKNKTWQNKQRSTRAKTTPAHRAAHIKWEKRQGEVQILHRLLMNSNNAIH